MPHCGWITSRGADQLIEHYCARLATTYCHLVDHGQAALAADLFSDDGVWRFGGIVWNGRSAIAAGLKARQDNTGRMSRHVCTNLLVDVIGATKATGVVYLTLYRHDGPAGRAESPMDLPTFVGEYRDEFVLTDQGWRISHRELHVSFRRL